MTENVRTKVFVISLPDAEARRSQFAKRAEGVSLRWEFFDAHRSLDSRLSYEPAQAIRRHGRELQPGELGCYSSHVSLWDRLLKDDAEQYVVLEDDVIVDWKMLQKIADHDFAAAGHHYVRLYHQRPSPFLVVGRRYISRSTTLLRLLDRAYGTQAYVVTRDGAERLAAACRNVRRPIDDQMDRFWEHGVPNLALFPSPIMEEAVPSEIGAERFGRESKRPTLGRRIVIWRDVLAMRRAAFRLRFAAKAREYARLIGMGQG